MRKWLQNGFDTGVWFSLVFRIRVTFGQSRMYIQIPFKWDPILMSSQYVSYIEKTNNDGNVQGKSIRDFLRVWRVSLRKAAREEIKFIKCVKKFKLYCRFIYSCFSSIKYRKESVQIVKQLQKQKLLSVFDHCSINIEGFP